MFPSELAFKRQRRRSHASGVRAEGHDYTPVALMSCHVMEHRHSLAMHAPRRERDQNNVVVHTFDSHVGVKKRSPSLTTYLHT
jgi:hypothetical protein